MKNTILLLCFSLITLTVNAQLKTVHNAAVRKVTLINRSAPVRTLASTPPDFSGKREVRENPFHEKKIKIQPNPNAQPVGDDPVWQKTTDATATTTVNIIAGWEGASTNVDPSDNTLAVSANYVVQVTNNNSNSVMNVWDKSGTPIAEDINTIDITGIADYGDPDLVYDQQADRFVLVLLKATGSKLIMAISETGDPTGVWDSYSFTTPDGFPDYPKISVWGDSYLLTTNSNNPTLWAVSRDNLLAGAAMGELQEFVLDDFGSIGFESASPICETGAVPPPAGTPAMFIRVGDDAWVGEDTDHLEIYFVDVNWVDPTLSTITGPYNLNTASYDSNLCGFDTWNCVPQPGTTVKLDPLSDIIMDKAQYRVFADHETIICSHVCRADVAGHSGVRWYELRKTATEDWFIYQQGTYAPDDGNYRFMSSITINDEGVIALGYNISSSTTNPGFRFTGKTECDDLGIMGAEEVIGQDGSHFNSVNRYGDYNAMLTDPSDGSFWFTGNFNPTSSWHTKVVHFSIDTCSATGITIEHDTIHWPDNTDITDVAFTNFSITPNPANTVLNISFGSHYNGTMKMELFDVTGKIIINKNISVQYGSNNFNLEVADIPAGTYLFSLTDDHQEIHKKIIVQHE